MAKKAYSEWGELVAAAQEAAKKILQKDVAKVGKEILKEHIENDIYGAYTPKTNGWVIGREAGGSKVDWTRTTYKRRNDLPKSVIALMENDGQTLTITNDNSKAVPRPALIGSFHNRRPGSFLQLLESGNMGLWKGGFARPAVSNAQREIDSSSDITLAIEQGIAREITG